MADSYFLLFTSILSLGVALVLVSRNQLTRIVGGIVFWIVWIMSLTYFVADYFTGEGVNDAFFYHLFTGVEGAGLSGLSHLFIGMAIFGILGVVMTYFFIIKPSQKIQKLGTNILAIILFLASIFVHPFLLGLIDYMGNNSGEESPELSSEFLKYFQTPDISNLKKGNYKNLVYIYLESFENNYLDEGLFPGLAPHLRDLRDKNSSFSGLEQAPGTGFTIGGMVASQCGMPLLASGGDNTMSGMDDFLPAAVCLGDILKASGYHLEYTGGATGGFAGKGEFYNDHGFDQYRGKEELVNFRPEKRDEWGLYDQDLFDYNYDRIMALHKQDQPFMYATLTLNTHNPYGFVDEDCADTYTEKSNITNSIHCSDFIVSRFVKKLIDAGITDDTLIVVGSDHLAMPNQATKTLEKKPRHNLLFMIDGKNEKNTKPGTTFDIGATILPRLGLDIDRIGFGHDLSGNEPTLVQSIGDTNKILEWKNDLKKFWSFPKFQDEVSIMLKEKKVLVHGRALKFPLLTQFDETGTPSEVWFEIDSDHKVVEYYPEISSGSNMLWIDLCTSIGKYVSNSATNKYCVATGKKGSEKVVPVLENLTIDPVP